METLRRQVNTYPDTNDKELAIVAAIGEVKDITSALLTLDPNTDWTGANVQRACDACLRGMREKPTNPTKPAKQTEERALNVKAYDLLNSIDELNLSMSCIGDPVHGGIEERRPVVALVGQLRHRIHASMFSSLDPLACVALTRQIIAQINLLSDVKSYVNGAPGFLSRVTPHAVSQCEAIIRKLGADVHVQPRGSLSIKP